ncbi:hypothetical protein K503DRAFT_870513 [Rhizopogon vinicolor AM-OR11-026]|uniref:Phosphatase PP2A regulatory subunit A/Splicing factor 3B subunit 1-like HEAT repeat domain-containing protein n=1 Tax=Rhizopogon vinicolor AM-OR11-026 TaxID=1314800 RepID=A0A1B7MGK2_9AGAM|nr:hypothetical protein K503DRAFT_870513 [Rhizopogon vinicolor AM-OR11-026]
MTYPPVDSFGYITKSLGLQDVLSILLTNLRVQERQSRVCSMVAIAIAIVAETCGPFTCIPAILNEYWTSELKSVYHYDSVVTRIEDALTDCGLVHCQTASVIVKAVKHIILGVIGMQHASSSPATSPVPSTQPTTRLIESALPAPTSTPPFLSTPLRNFSVDFDTPLYANESCQPSSSIIKVHTPAKAHTQHEYAERASTNCRLESSLTSAPTLYSEGPTSLAVAACTQTHARYSHIR